MSKDLKALIEYPKEGILSKEVFKNEIFDCTLFSMAGGTEISTHTSSKQGLIYIIEGKGIFDLAGEKIIMEPGVFFYMKENAAHSLKVEMNTAFLLILVTGNKYEKNQH